MAVTSEERQLRDEKIRAALEGIEEKDLVKWYGRWRNEPWTYALVKTLEKIPVTLLVVSVVSWEKTKLLFTDPIIYIRDRMPLLVIAFFFFVLVFHFAWRSKAMHYYLLAKTNPNLEIKHGDKVYVFGNRAERRLIRNYQRWGKHRLGLSALFALLLPVLFFSLLYTINGAKSSVWSVQAFFSVFEEGTDVFVFAFFFFFGALMGYGIGKEINKNYQLLQKAKPTSEL